MPRLSSFYGIAVYMYNRDHGVAHFHARYGDDEAVIEAATGRVLRGGLPPRQAKLVQEWAGIHRDELLGAWGRSRSGEPTGTIEPLP
jgi:hypothetical protein